MAKKRRSPKQSAPKAATRPQANWPVALLALAGALVTGYLTGIAYLDGASALCTAGSGCDVIQQSRWSQVLGLPLALWGLGFYVLIGGLAWRGTSKTRDWKRLWTLSLIASGISVYLTLVGLWNLGAICLWCLASLILFLAIFITLTLKRPAGAPDTPWPQWATNRGVWAIILIGALHFYYHYDTLFSNPRLTALAEHLDQTGAEYYGASWCGNCQRQHALFGQAKDALPYIECSPNGRHAPVAMACRRANVESFPTWIINGQRYEGVQKPRELARHSGFDWENVERR